jgi:hypothetical protein
MPGERIKLLTTIKKGKKGESLSGRALHIIFVLCELKSHDALRHFSEHLVCIRRESKPTYSSYAKKGKN